MSEPSFWPDAPGARVMMRMGSIGADGDDPGSEPDWHTLEGAKVHLTPSVRVVTFEGIVAPLLDVDGVIDADGYLKTVEGQLPVFVLATDDPRLSTTGWLWSAQIIDHNVTIRFPAPSDGVVNLADYLTAEPSDSTREWVERIPELLEAAGRLDTEAVAAVENAVVNLELVQGRTIPDGTPGLGVSVPFADGSRNALEVDSRGRPTPLSAALHVEAEQGLMGQALGIETRTDLDMPDTAALFVFDHLVDGLRDTLGADHGAVVDRVLR